MIDYTTPVGQIRNYIYDTNELNPIFSDDQLQAFYDGQNEYLPFAIRDALNALMAKYVMNAGDEYRLDTIEYNEGKSKASFVSSLIDKINKEIEEGSAPGQSLGAHTYGIKTDEALENAERIKNGELIPPRHYDREADTIKVNPLYGPYYGA